MKVVYDDQIFHSQRMGGISRYFVDLIQAFNLNPELDVVPIPRIGWTFNQHATSAGLARRLPQPIGTRGLRRVSRIGLVRLARSLDTLVSGHEGNADVLHSTFYAQPKSFSKFQGLRVCTIYDMVPEFFPELFPRGNPHKFKAEYATVADAIICISDSTRKDFLDYYGDPGVPISTAHLGVSDFWHVTESSVNDAPWESALAYVGARGSYKDFAVLLRALRELPPSIRLVTVGGGALTARERLAIRDLGLEHRIRHETAPDKRLKEIYQNAGALIYPSRYEGFGLPILEAMAAGCPTVIADTAVSHEIASDGAVYFPVGDHHALAQQIDKVLKDEELRTQLIKRGKARAQAFSWERCAAVHARAYKESLLP